MANPCDYLAEIAEDFEILTSRQDQLLTLRQYGDYLDAMDAHLKTDSALVPGCASATHIVGELQADGTMRFMGDSESFISKGYIYILIEALNDTTPETILKSVKLCVHDFAEKAGVRLSTIQSRANVFENVFTFMQRITVEQVASKSS